MGRHGSTAHVIAVKVETNDPSAFKGLGLKLILLFWPFNKLFGACPRLLKKSIIAPVGSFWFGKLLTGGIENDERKMCRHEVTQTVRPISIRILKSIWKERTFFSFFSSFFYNFGLEGRWISRVIYVGRRSLLNDQTTINFGGGKEAEHHTYVYWHMHRESYPPHS